MRLIKLEQPNCSPCRMVSAFLDSKGVSYEAIDVTEHPEVAAEYAVMSVPVTILFDGNSNEVARSRGYNPPELESLIAQL